MDLIRDDEIQDNPCQTTGYDIFSHENITACENNVRSIQRKLDKAVANGDKTNIRWHTHQLSKKSRAVKILAIHRICEVNQGRHTAGVDGVGMPKDRDNRRLLMFQLLNEIDINKSPSPIRRVFIPKPNGDLRPLGIPTIADRITQEIIRQTIEPICEYHFLTCSYGFRPKRSCHDAIADLFIKLARKGSRRWIVEGDVEKCFDNINHEHIIATLKEWGVPNTYTTIIKNMLEAGIMHGLDLTPSLQGTPQGGVISPMLANVALTTLDNEVMKVFGKRDMNPIVRYADDFVIVAQSENHANKIKSHIKEHLKSKVGLQLSDEKTHITEISKGFNFLGFNIRKYDNKLLIKPSRENVYGLTRKISQTFKDLSTATPEALISKLNPILIGWGNYYRHVVSKLIFSQIDATIWKMTEQWCRNKHPNKAKYWKGKYFKTDTWRFYDKETGKTLTHLRDIPIKRFVKVKDGMRIYDANAREYWEKREYMNALDNIQGAPIMSKLFREQSGKCGYCKQPITESQVKGSETINHHMKPRSKGGDWKLRNLRLLHADCHNQLHDMYSRTEMADYIDKGIDYLRLMKPAK